MSAKPSYQASGPAAFVSRKQEHEPLPRTGGRNVFLALSRRAGDERQGVNRSGQRLRKGAINQPLSGDPAKADEGLRFHHDREVALPARAGAGMSGMLGGIVHHV